MLEEMHANRWYTNFGPLATRFENAMAAFLKRPTDTDLHAASFSSATTGLELVLRALRLPKAGRVLIPALTFPATATAIINASLAPVLGDVDPETWELTADYAEEAHRITPLAAVMPVAAFGRPIDVAAWQKFQKNTGVPVVLDAAASLGQQETPADIVTVFSLHATKAFGVGEGGLVVSGDADLLARAKSLSNFGFSGGAGIVHQVGTNAKFGEYYAAVGLAQLDRWAAVHTKRQQVLSTYLAALKTSGVQHTLQKDVGDFVPAVFVLSLNTDTTLMHEKMAAAGIQTRKWYLPLLYDHPALAHLDYALPGGKENLRVCGALQHKLLGIPFHTSLSAADINLVCGILSEVTNT